jgi:hypothetical protein
LSYAATVSERLLKLLDVVQRELGADEARIELGTREAEDPCVLSASLRSGWRLVVVFSSAPASRDEVLEKLTTFAQSFTGVTAHPEEWSTMNSELVGRRLDDELAEIAERAGAVRALVIDRQSPMIWGTSGPRRTDEDVDTGIKIAEALDAVAAAGVDLTELMSENSDRVRQLLEKHGAHGTFLIRESDRIRGIRRSEGAWKIHLLVSRAIRGVRRTLASDPHGAHLREMVHQPFESYLARAFASIYCLILVFDGEFTELHAEAAAVHGIPAVERLVLALPPVDPPPPGGKLISLRQPKT